MYIPGRILHMYQHNGIFKGAMVPRDHPALQVSSRIHDLKLCNNCTIDS